MNNIYFLESSNHLILYKYLKKILEDNHVLNEELTIYDLEEINISEVIMDLDTYSFFNTRKVVYCKNASFLTTNKGEIEHNIDIFLKYLNNPNPNNILIISCAKADSKKNVVKELKKKAKCLEMNFNIRDYIKEKCHGYKIKESTIDYFLASTGDDLDNITNELGKLLNLKYQEKEITNEDIDKVVIKKIDSNLFDLIDAIISKNKAKSLSIYNNMINYGEDIFKIFIALANQIRLIYQVKTLKRLSNEEIVDLLNLKNPKQVVALRYKIDKYSSQELLNYLYKLAIMDEELKLGKSIDQIAFPTFIANL